MDALARHDFLALEKLTPLTPELPIPKEPDDDAWRMFSERVPATKCEGLQHLGLLHLCRTASPEGTAPFLTS